MSMLFELPQRLWPLNLDPDLVTRCVGHTGDDVEDGNKLITAVWLWKTGLLVVIGITVDISRTGTWGTMLKVKIPLAGWTLLALSTNLKESFTSWTPVRFAFNSMASFSCCSSLKVKDPTDSTFFPLPPVARTILPFSGGEVISKNGSLPLNKASSETFSKWDFSLIRTPLGNVAPSAYLMRGFTVMLTTWLVRFASVVKAANSKLSWDDSRLTMWYLSFSSWRSSWLKTVMSSSSSKSLPCFGGTVIL